MSRRDVTHIQDSVREKMTVFFTVQHFVKKSRKISPKSRTKRPGRVFALLPACFTGKCEA